MKLTIKDRCIICKIGIADTTHNFRGDERPICNNCKDRAKYVSKMVGKAKQ